MWRRFEPGGGMQLELAVGITLVSFDGITMGQTDIGSPNSDAYYLISSFPHFYHILTDLNRWIAIDIRTKRGIPDPPFRLDHKDLAFINSTVANSCQSGKMMSNQEYLEAFEMAEECIKLFEDSGIFRDEEVAGLPASEAPPDGPDAPENIPTTTGGSESTEAKGKAA